MTYLRRFGLVEWLDGRPGLAWLLDRDPPISVRGGAHVCLGTSGKALGQEIVGRFEPMRAVFPGSPVLRSRQEGGGDGIRGAADGTAELRRVVLRQRSSELSRPPLTTDRLCLRHFQR